MVSEKVVGLEAVQSEKFSDSVSFFATVKALVFMMTAPPLPGKVEGDGGKFLVDTMNLSMEPLPPPASSSSSSQNDLVFTNDNQHFWLFNGPAHERTPFL